MKMAAGKIAAPASTVEYSSTFCTNCWPMYIAPMSEPKTMMPAHGRHPERRTGGYVEVVERVRGATLSDDERDAGRQRHDGERHHERSLVGHGREVDGQDERRDQDDGEDAAEVVDRFGALVRREPGSAARRAGRRRRPAGV